jgi:sugar phosphate isomerase/epimerase
MTGAGGDPARVGLALYGVRDECERDLEGTLRAVAAIGYTGVEFYSLHGHDAGRVREWLDQTGLVAVSRHAALEPLEDDLAGLARELETLGTRRLTLAWIEAPTTAAAAGQMAQRIGAIGTAARAHGLEFGIHNHYGEVHKLDDGRAFLDRLLELVDLYLELDLGWIWWGGHDPVQWLEAARKRVPMVHVKDFVEPGVRRYCSLGDGSMDYARILPAARAACVEWLLVEQDEADGSTLEAAARSYGALIPLLAAT